MPIILSTFWISASEFIRNELFFKSYWLEHYDKLNLKFPSEPVNGAIWGIWSLFFAIAIFIISRKLNLFQTVFIAWLTGFVLMWIAIGNLGVLPCRLLWIAVPLSLLEVFLAALIIRKTTGQ